MTAQPELEAFLEKWRARWPEWRVAQIFVPELQRTLAETWFTLLHELTDAAWGGSDAAPGAAKLAWWQEELQGWHKGVRRHPLGSVLLKQGVHWQSLADTLPLLMDSRDAVLSSADSAATASSLESFAAAVARIETSLFAADSISVDSDQLQNATRIDALTLIAAHRLASGLEADNATLIQWCRAMPPTGQKQMYVRPRRIHDALLSERLRLLSQSAQRATVSPWRTVWLAWRAARQ